MKKFLSIVSIFSLTTTGATTLVACTKVGDSKDESNDSKSNNDLAKIKIIEAPEEMTVMDPIAVTKAEIKIVLDPIFYQRYNELIKRLQQLILLMMFLKIKMVVN